MKSLLLARAFRVGGVVAVLCAVAALGTPMARRIAHDYAFDEALAIATSRPGVLPGRLVAPRPRALASLAACSQRTRAFAIAEVLERAKSDASPAAQHAAGIASLLTNQPADAVRYLGAVTRSSKDAHAWTHLGAAQYALAVERNDDEQLLASLGAVEHALMLQPKLAEANYDFALAVERLGIAPAAAALWNEYLVLHDRAAWKQDAQQRVRAIARRRPANALWPDLVRRAGDDARELARITALHPQQARLWAAAEFFANWAEAARRGEQREANRWIARARVVGRALKSTTGESLLHDSVAAIDVAKDDSILIDAHLRYVHARTLYREENVRAAKKEFELARARFTQGRSPMAAMAAAFAASTLHESDQLEEARRRTIALLAAQRRANPPYYALRAQLYYQLARLEATRGYWSASITTSTQASAIYERIRETGFQAMAALLTAEAYDYIGQPSIANRHWMTAIRLLAESGDNYRLRVATANLCRAAMRRGWWDTAHAVIRIERSIENLSPDASLTSDSYMRAAVIEKSLDRPAAAERALHLAASRASAVTDESLRQSLLADINGARGAMTRQSRPKEAVAFLDQSIAYQEHAGRAMFLPQLYLERARAHLALHDPSAAASDLERGIVRLELQRSRVQEPAMRYGIFDSTHELFSDLVSLHLRRRNLRAAFAVLERGRARALLEQIAGTPRPLPPLQVEAVQRVIPADTLLVEYMVLRDRLLLFVITHDAFDVHEVRIDAAIVAAKSSALVAALVARRPVAEIHELAADLHGLLIAPIRQRARFRNLILVLDAALQQVPFAALYDRAADAYLAEQHHFVGVPSAAVFLEGRARLRTAKSPLRTIAVFAGAIADPMLKLRTLADAEQEAAKTAAPYKTATLFAGPEATVERLLDQAPRVDVLHFAGHALIDATDPSRSALVLSASETDPGLLRCREIGEQRFKKPRVVVLAACSTISGGGGGHTDGTPSIARSFLAAGVPAVVGTLWDIEDSESVELVTQLHENLTGGLTPAEALRQAQLTAMRGQFPASRHPGSWAAFALLGAGGL